MPDNSFSEDRSSSREREGQVRRQKAPDEKFCGDCGAVIKEAAEICPECGVRQSGSVLTQKNAGLAAVLSFFWSGLGQIYNGQIAKGLGIMLLQLVNFVLIAFLIGLITLPIVWLWAIYDAYTTAERINAGEITV